MQPLYPLAKPVEMCDVECYVNYFLIKFYDPATKEFTDFELRGHAARFTQQQTQAIRARLARVTFVTFNGIKYDVPMITCATYGFSCEQLKAVTNAIIGGNLQPWEVESQFAVKIAYGLDHIDLIEVAPGDGSLKIYGGRLHCKFMQDLPIDHNAVLTEAEMDIINKYCGNDLTTTADLYFAVKEDLDTRADLTEQYGVDMRSKSDAQIAEAAFKKLLGLDYRASEDMKRRAFVPAGTQFFYETPSFIKFTTPVLQQALAMIERSPFTIQPNGQPKMTDELAACEIRIGDSVYRLGSGGLHSSEQRTRHVADAMYSLRDVDVVSYYPKIISILRMFPHQMGEVFLTIYDGWIEVRIEYKDKGQKKKAATFKIKINGTFGKTGSKYSIIYAPKMMIRTTVTGQLSLLMLIELLESVDGISVVSANTDGVVIKCRRDREMIRDAIVARWERDTGFTTEANDYMALFSRDVNNYMAVKPPYTDKKGVFHPLEFKCKGAYADPGLQKNPTNIVCVDAVKAYVTDGIDLEKTIRGCSDIRKFVTVRGVKGGGEWVKETVMPMTVGQKRAELESRLWVFDKDRGWSDLFGGGTYLTIDAALDVVRAKIEKQHLGKAVRWYYGRDQKGHIAYASNGNLVARSEGAKPCMQLPDVLPPDIDYDWYVNEARELLRDISCA